MFPRLLGYSSFSVSFILNSFLIFLTENTSPSNTPHTSANIVMTPQGQLLTLKGPLFSGPVVTVSPALLEADLKPQVASSAMAQSGMSSVLSSMDTKKELSLVSDSDRESL